MSNFFLFFGYFIPFIYIPLRAKEINDKIPNKVDDHITSQHVSYLFSIIGKSSFI
jgi:hypothetical protein